MTTIELVSADGNRRGGYKLFGRYTVTVMPHKSLWIVEGGWYSRSGVQRLAEPLAKTRLDHALDAAIDRSS